MLFLLFLLFLLLLLLLCRKPEKTTEKPRKHGQNTSENPGKPRKTHGKIIEKPFGKGGGQGVPILRGGGGGGYCEYSHVSSREGVLSPEKETC